MHDEILRYALNDVLSLGSSSRGSNSGQDQILSYNVAMKKYRFYILVVMIVALWLSLLGRGAYLQLLPNEKLAQVKERQFQKIVKLSSRRGDIFDRGGDELAISILSYSLFADPKLLENPRKAARMVARKLNLSYKNLYEKFKKKKSRFVWVQRRLDRKDYDEIRDWKIRGLAFKEEYKRIYPGGNLGSHVLGFVGREVQGLSGLESFYDTALKGNPQKIRLQRDARGRSLVEDGYVFTKHPEGSDLFLTIDKDLQYWVEKELKATVEHHEAEGGWAVVLDPKDSAILSMASFPDFNSNRPKSSKSANRRNKVIHDVHEVGSVIKTFTIAGALKNGLVEPNTMINTENGRFKIGKRVIREAQKSHNFKELSVSEILAYSSNVGTAKLALEMGDQEVYENLLNFGFRQKTGVDIPGEAQGLVSKPPWKNHLTANISFGHGVAVTGLQVANAYAAIANGGVLHRPYLVQKVYDYESGKVSEFGGQEIRRVLPESVAQQMKMMLSQVTGQGGTGFNARIDGFPVAGKTGTAQKVDPEKGGYRTGKYIANFAGFVPANDPQFVIYAVIDSGSNKHGYTGTSVAAPLFRSIARFALRRDRTEPAYLSNSQTLPSENQSEKKLEPSASATVIPLVKVPAPAEKIKMPNLNGMVLREVLREFQGMDIKLQVSGDTGQVINHSPKVGQVLKAGEKVKIKFQ